MRKCQLSETIVLHAGQLRLSECHYKLQILQQGISNASGPDTDAELQPESKDTRWEFTTSVSTKCKSMKHI